MMHLSRPLAAILGLLSIWPAVYSASFIVLMLSTMLGGLDDQYTSVFEAIFVVHLLTMLIVVGLLIFYIVHLFKNEALPDERRVLWAIVLFMGNLVAIPVYWYIYVWRRPARTAG